MVEHLDTNLKLDVIPVPEVMKRYGQGGVAPLILNLGARWM